MELWDTLLSQPPKLLRAKSVKGPVSEDEFDSTREEIPQTDLWPSNEYAKTYKHTLCNTTHTHTHTIVFVYQLSLQIISI